MEVMEINEKLAESKNEDSLREIEILIKGRFEGFVQSPFTVFCVTGVFLKT